MTVTKRKDIRGLLTSDPHPRFMRSKQSLSSRTEVHRLDSGLYSITGAQEVIAEISSRRKVTKLLLGHNRLGCDGCTVLFTFLKSDIGSRYPIAEISLNSNHIGNRGLLAIAQYLSGNGTLRELFIQANRFTGDPDVIEKFAQAVNSASSLETLALSSNNELGDAFAEHFLPLLDSRSLRELHLSSIGLTPRSVPHINGFVKRCSLSTLKCNGNTLGIRGVQSIARVIRRHNYSLTTMEFLGNSVQDGMEEYVTEGDEGDRVDDSAGDTVDSRKALQQTLSQLAVRNITLKRRTERQALQLLRYARTLLLHSRLTDSGELSSAATKEFPHTHITIPGTFPFSSLPIELQLDVLAHLAPDLSVAQRNRIFHYAASPTTLPPLLPRLYTSPENCLPDPGNIAFGTRQVSAVKGNIPCDTGMCMGSRNTVACNVETDRSKWLSEVRCNVYDPD